MLPEDLRRLEREAAIAKAVGSPIPDYTLYDKGVRAVKAERRRRFDISNEYHAMQAAGYFQMCIEGTVERDEHGKIPSFRPNPTMGI